jgi:signal transduction histidine kinase
MASGQHGIDATRRHGTPSIMAGVKWQYPLLHLALGLVWIGVAAGIVHRADSAASAGMWLTLIAALLVTTAIIAVWGRSRSAFAHASSAHCEADVGTARVEPPAGASGHALRELMRLLPDGVLLLVEDQVVYANPAGHFMFGAPPGTLNTVSAGELIDREDRARFDAWLRVPISDTGEAPASLRMRRRDGSIFRAALTAAQTEHDGRPCTLLLVRDLTAVERMRDDLAAGNRELQALAARVFTLQEDERRTISRELHDDIGQSVTAMKMAAGSALDETDARRRRDDIEDIIMLADSTLERLRDISILLRPPQLDALGLEAALRWHADRMLRNAGIASDLEIDALPQRPDAAVEQACFRIAQEALTNAMRHAGAARVELRLRDEGDGLRLRVRDDGCGFSPAVASGLGLVIMRERAHGAGGRVEVASTPGAGTHVEAWLPYAAPPPAAVRGS